MANEKKIRILAGGPYQVSGDIPLRDAVIRPDSEGASDCWGEGKTYPCADNKYYLCRCGHSNNKPFCDGAHKEAGFTGEETARREGYAQAATFYPGETLDLLDDESLCASMRFCDNAISVWDGTEQSDDAGMREAAIKGACNCAAGRLTVLEKDGTPLEPALPQEISPVQDTVARWRGPLWVKGGIHLEGADGRPYEARNRMTLCRCGESSNLPFCDTTHLSCPHMKGHDE